MMKLYAPFIREATLRVTMTLRSEGHGGDPSPKLQGGKGGSELLYRMLQFLRSLIIEIETRQAVAHASKTITSR